MATESSLSGGQGAYEAASETVWGFIYGQLRGLIPFPVPFDLAAVAVSATIRMASTLADSGTVNVQADSVIDSRPIAFQGWTLSELVCLWRYRVRTA